MHYKLGILYLSDASGAIHFLQPGKQRDRKLLTEGGFEGMPLDLSVDWLFNRLYIVVRLDSEGAQEWEVWSCSLLGESLRKVYGNLLYEPKHLHVDPSNG